MTALGAAACGSKVGSLSITVERSWRGDQEPLVNVARTVRLRAEGANFEIDSPEFPEQGRAGSLDEVPLDQELHVTLEGCDPSEKVTSRGRSGPLVLHEGERNIGLYVGRVKNSDSLQQDAGTFSNTPNDMCRGRAFHTATLLPDGSVLLSGGSSNGWWPESSAHAPNALRSTEWIDGNALTFDADPDRCAATATRCDGEDGKPPRCVSPSANLPGCMICPRVGHSATLLPTGVIIGGGYNGTALNDTVETYQSDQRSFLLGPHMTPRAWHEAALYQQDVVFVGGQDAVGMPVAASEVYDQGSVRSFLSLAPPRRAFTLTDLADGGLFAAGGFVALERGASSAEEVTSSTATLRSGAPGWTAGPTLATARSYHTATRLADGTVLLLGGLSGSGQPLSSMERFDPLTRTLTTPSASLNAARWAHTATMLRDGRILVVGGMADRATGTPLASVEIVEVRDQTAGGIVVRSLGNLLREARAGHSATLLQSGWVLVAGGVSGATALDTAEVFVY
jgi:hypothetical protein